MRNISLNKALAVFLTIGACCNVSAAHERMSPRPEPQQVTLYSRITYKEHDYGKSAFNFEHGLRSDDESWARVAHGYAQLMYGSISFSADTDWFSVSMGGDDPTRIKDLGELQWSGVYSTPILYANPRQSTGITFPRPSESFEASSDERVTKVVAGHMYLVHVKNREADLYVMFRVDALEPNDHCTLSWKVVPSPEK